MVCSVRKTAQVFQQDFEISIVRTRHLGDLAQGAVALIGRNASGRAAEEATSQMDSGPGAFNMFAEQVPLRTPKYPFAAECLW